MWLTKDRDGYAQALGGLHAVTFACLILRRAAEFNILSAKIAARYQGDNI
jgi:hypothetical protein